VNEFWKALEAFCAAWSEARIREELLPARCFELYHLAQEHLSKRILTPRLAQEFIETVHENFGPVEAAGPNKSFLVALKNLYLVKFTF
jgi:hypothetical protein